MKQMAPILLLLLTTMAFTAINVAFASSANRGVGILEVANNICVLAVSNETGLNLSIVEIFILAFCFLFAVGLVMLWQFCFRKKR